MEPLRTILVPVDFSRASHTALEAALRLRHEGTDLVIVHVIDQAWIDFTVELGYGMPADVEAKARMHAEKHMRRLTEIADDGVERVITVGRPVEKVLALARELDADLVVLGRLHVEKIPPGSFAEQILRHAPCPVLALPGDSGIADVEDNASDNAPAGAPSTN